MKYSFEFLQTGGVPLTNDLMALIEEAYGIFETLADVAGNLTILSGAEIIGSTVNPGIVAIEGKLYYFEGGTITSTVYVNTEEIQETFQDQTTKTLIKKRTVKFGLSTETYNWADFVRLETLKAIQEKVNNSVTQQQLNQLITRVETVELKTAPIKNGGIVLVWRKPLSEIPAGWKPCTDFRGKTIFGRDPNDGTFSMLGSTVGSQSKTILKTNLPAVGLQYEDVEPGNPDWGFGGYDGGNNHFTRRAKTTQNLGSGTPLDVLNPGVIVDFIEPDFQ